MKKLILLLVLSLVLSTSIAGVDNMEQRQPGQDPVEQKDKDKDDDDHHHGGNHNAPFESFDILLISFMIIVVYGVYHLRDEHKKT
jgi:hypothetical protein